ncbi:MAG TPA: acetolactate synthase [Syntrophomonadaceae bacterium]|nr:acetolactate synthase [Syntrophomonadaceae bacterium]HNX28388.1 acetolactate synthase [Syntrophomonadaceae bacterium]HPR92680.1 acetolactate synthase [Syntrophomonadaceae bacterium]
MFITQISVYLENARGTLREMTKLLAENEIDIMALSIADTSNFGIVRMIIREACIDKAVNCMKNAGFMVKKTKVLCVGVPNKPGALDNILAVIEETDISIEYLYSFNYSVDGDALFVIRLLDSERVIELFKARNIRLYSQEEINRL